ncbi:MAG: alpha/beta hydrolase [Caulobacteraceae bacterium]|nr:alpha/beta hydrolase [Caulobacteraceae bacterium]
MEAIRTRQIEANGLTFAVDEAGEGDAVALLLHGFPESRRSWRAQLPALAALGWRAVAPDLRGYGGSSRPSGRAAYGMDQLIGDVAGLFDALGARRRLLIAHDWGGVVAWAFAIERARPLDGLVILNAPHPAAYLEHLRRSPSQMLKSWYVAFFQLPWLPEALTTAAGARAVRRAFTATAANPACFTPELLDHYAEAARAPGAMTAMINYYRANAAGLGRWGPGQAAPIEVPTLVLWGERDPFLDPALANPGKAYALDLTVERLPHAAHWVQQEDAVGVNRRLADWLKARD